MNPVELTSHNDTLNFQEDHLTMVYGPHLEEDDNDRSPFYITINVHDKLLHNFMLG